MTRLYLITPPAFDPDIFAPQLEVALDAGDVACVQLRLKQVSDDVIKRAADRIRPLIHSRDVSFIMNDRPDLARDCGCDGVHIGAEDMDYKAARALLGPQATIGVTCKASRHLAIEAAEAGADYVAFGSFFPTQTKEDATPADIQVLRWWSDVATTPAVAIGGITPGNCLPLVESGVDFLAMIGAIWNHPQGPAAAVKEFEKILKPAV